MWRVRACAVLLGISGTNALLAFAFGKPWYVVAYNAALVVLTAIVLRRNLDRIKGVRR